MEKEERARKIAALNDELRCNLTPAQTYISQGIEALDDQVRAEIMQAVMEYDEFDEDSDPEGHHDYGTVQVRGRTAVWKVDAFDLRMKFASSDPADPGVTRRILTILLPSEW